MGVIQEQVEAFLLGRSVSPVVDAEIVQQRDDPGSPLSAIARRFAQAARRFADPEGPLLTAIAPQLDVTFDQLAEINNRCGICLREKRWNDAYPLRLTTCRLALRFLGEGHRDTATYINSLGRILYERGEFDRAVRVYERAIELRSQYFGERHSDTGISWAGLGRVLEALAQYDDARECHQFALDVMEENFGPDHPDTGVSLTDLGCVAFTLRDLATTETCFQRAAAIAREIEGSDDPIYAGRLVHLGMLQGANRDLAAAERSYLEALSIYERSFGENHADVAWCLDCLAGLRLQQNDLAAAKESLDRASQILIGVTDSPMLKISVFNNLAVVLRLQGKTIQARRNLREASKTSRRLFGPDHPTTLVLERHQTILKVTDWMARSDTRLSVYQTIVPFGGQALRFFHLLAAA